MLTKRSEARIPKSFCESACEDTVGPQGFGGLHASRGNVDGLADDREIEPFA